MHGAFGLDVAAGLYRLNTFKAFIYIYIFTKHSKKHRAGVFLLLQARKQRPVFHNLYIFRRLQIPQKNKYK